MRTNLIAQFNTNLNKPIKAMPEYYKAFKENFENKIKADYGDLDSLSAPKPYDVNNGVGIIDFKGFTVNDADPIEEMFFGVISLQRFQQNLSKMIDDDSVTKAVINFDSGGGYVMGGIETMELVKQLTKVKPIIAYTSGLMCSQAYEIASACSYIYASPSAYVGSIGVISQYMNYTGTSTSDGSTTTFNSPDLGVEVTTFQGGSQKTIGSPFVPLTAEQKLQIQNDVNALHAEFKENVIDGRGLVNDDFMQGQPFTGTEAAQLNTNLVDGLSNSLSQIVGLIQNT